MAAAIALPVVPAPSSPADRFNCAHYACVLAARDCVARQETRGVWKGESRGRRVEKKFVPLRLQFCASGKCEQGKAIAAAVAGKKEDTAA